MADSLDRAGVPETDAVDSAADEIEYRKEARTDDFDVTGLNWTASNSSHHPRSRCPLTLGGESILMEPNGNVSLLVCTQSTTILSIQYEAESSVMRVTFKSGFVYQYEGVSKEAWDKFTLAESKGKHFAAEIKPRYTGRKL